MLFGQQCGNKYQYCNSQRCSLIPDRNFFSSSDTNITEPADKTVNRREKIICRIYRIKPHRRLVPQTTSSNLRSCIGRRKQKKKRKTYAPGQKICCKKLIYTFFILSGNENIIQRPENITSKIYNQKLRNKWQFSIKTALDIIMIPVSCNHSGS